MSYSAREAAFWGRAGAIEHHFSGLTAGIQDAAGPAEPVGPSSNTGQKSPKASTLTAPLIDFCTLVFDTEKSAKLFRRMSMSDVVRYVFGTGDSIVVGPLMDRVLNVRYPRSATLIDCTSSVAGKVGVTDSGEVCIVLSGQGCQHVPNWNWVHQVATDLGAHLTRLDIAVDDLTGETFDIHRFHDLYLNGAFAMNGRPPQGSFVDDMGSRKGCSLYVGQKGHKQLNVYEKGKQLGDPDSGHTRCELRLYAKRTELPLDALINPGRYFGGAYPVLEELVIGEFERLKVKERMVNASVKAMAKFMRTQVGTHFGALLDAVGEERTIRIIADYMSRPGRPGRFKTVTGDYLGYVKNQLDELFPSDVAA
ncbi:replication initiation factor domain-containing protein [Flavobacterium sp. MXW15]|uniref:Replication initiation factor domain-containing protein n=1 Tax=Xanthomonas chitinilytica TaxID=2989819 RepID=A0ABT3JY29_9XANT|nr:replication initiation factor domain-containing protein [Xanthomonas sp. H13-6]MCW4455541.1 replication initiation factor domain-containing protein [Flavobacterium sp. MXW15]MCW4473378.1 replication initiation factor domain-containing protein [Xanthomonas sp. H13-6]